MPAPRNQPTRASQRRNSLQDETPGRTRGRGAKSAPSKPEQPELEPPKPSPTKLSPTATRKTTRSASNISGRSTEAVSDVYASYERPLFMVFGLSPEFFEGLRKHHGKLPKQRKLLVTSFPPPSSTSEGDDHDSELGLLRQDSESEEESARGSEVEQVPLASAASRGRSRGGRGARGGYRGRGARGKGRGGRGRGGNVSRGAAATRGKSARNAGAMVPLAEEEDEEGPNQGSTRSSSYFSPLPLPHNEDEPMGEPLDSDMENENAIEDDDEPQDDDRVVQGQPFATISPSSPPSGGDEHTMNGGNDLRPAQNPVPDASVKTTKIPPIPKIKLPTKSASHTPRPTASTPAVNAVPKLLAPEDDVLSDSDLPEPWVYDALPVIEAECEDRADYLLQTRFKPMVDVSEVIATVTKYAASQRSTESLFALAANTQNILQEFQDQYLKLDARTAPHMQPAKKACNGGRIPMAEDVFEAMKEADLYGYTYDHKKLPGAQDPWGQRPGAEKSGGRELRTRRHRDMLDSAPASEEDEDEDHEGRRAKRQRKATRKFDGSDAGTGTGANTPKKHNGWGGARKKGVSRFSNIASETPEPESRPTKRARIAASNLLHQRIQEMREQSLVSGSGDEESSAMDVDDCSDTNVKRGRPAGSKNVARRSDFGVKKGPRKKTSEAGTPVPSAHGPNAPPPALQSMSDGQGQFSIDPQPPLEPSALAANSAEAAFQANPQPPVALEAIPQQLDASNTPDAYMITAPLSQYTNNYMDDSSPASGSRRKPRVKSEKRSQSMTIWWAERKARKKEQDEKNPQPKAPSSLADSSTGRRGGRGSTGSVVGGTPSAEPQRPPSMHHHEQPQQQYHQSPPESYPIYGQPPPLTAPSPLYMYASAPPAPPPGMMLQYSPLAALPSSAYPFAGPPMPNPQHGSRALAPAPISLQHPAYPSPYGPQSPASARPQSSGHLPRSGPPPLAPAPTQHFSPYAPMSAGRDASLKVMIPPASNEARRESR